VEVTTTDVPTGTDELVACSAGKADDAEVPVELWNTAIRNGLTSVNLAVEGAVANVDWALDVMHKWICDMWKQKLVQEFVQWWKCRRAVAKDRNEALDLRSVVKGAAALAYVADASWWDWDRGLAAFFWRWPAEFQSLIRDRLAPHFVGPPPSYRQPYKEPKDSAI